MGIMKSCKKIYKYLIFNITTAFNLKQKIQPVGCGPVLGLRASSGGLQRQWWANCSFKRMDLKRGP